VSWRIYGIERTLSEDVAAPGTYVEVIEAVQRDALDSMGSLFAHTRDGSKHQLPSNCRQTAQTSQLKGAFFRGGANGTRTRDPHTARSGQIPRPGTKQPIPLCRWRR